MLRVWDCLFHEGDTVLFRVAIVLLENCVPLLVKCKNTSDAVALIRDIGTLPIAVNCHELLQVTGQSAVAFA